jgi:hypothetical protein
MKKKKKKVIDWKGIEKDYRVGKTSNRQIAEWYDVSEGAIRKRAIAENWSRMMRPGPENAGSFQKLSFTPVEPVVKTPEEARQIVSRGKGLIYRMIDELDATTSKVGELEDMIIEETAGDKDGRRRTGMLRAIDLPARANTIKALALAAKTLVDTLKADVKSPADESAEVVKDGEKSGDDWDRLLN